jgi:folate-binding protein YgfZ
MEQNHYIKNTFSKFIEIKGKDSINFLQGLITNDINKCNNEHVLIYSCFLSPQGKFLADFFISKYKNFFLIEIHEKYFDVFYDKLKIYKLRSDVEFNENSDLLSFMIFNSQDLVFNKSIVLFDDPRNKNLGKKIYLDKNSLDLEIFTNLNELKYDKYKEYLIKNLVPHSPDDLIENKSLLLENNFQNINAIDWDKGCYIGQEITARMKYRSLLKKKIYLLEMVSGNINIDDDIILDEVNIGKVISKVDQYILCMLKINLIDDKNLKKETIEMHSSTVLRFL